MTASGSVDAGLLLRFLFVFGLAGPYSSGTLHPTASFGWSVLVRVAAAAASVVRGAARSAGYHFSFRGARS